MSRINPEVLRRLREAKGLSQLELSERTKINVSTISRLERGEQNDTRPATFGKLGRALNVAPDVLTGEAPLPEIAPAPQKLSSNIRLSRQADNALELVAERYLVKRWQVMELAPLMFCWAAEMSLRQRRNRIREIEGACRTVRELEHEMRHMPVPNLTYTEAKIAAENGSIDANDIFGLTFDDNDLLDGSFHPKNEHTDNPFAVFLAGLVADLGEIATFEEFSAFDYPIYQVCTEEASRLAGGGSEEASSILNGEAVLSEMPKELRGPFAKDEDRAEWVRAQAEEHREGFDSISEFRAKPKKRGAI